MFKPEAVTGTGFDVIVVDGYTMFKPGAVTCVSCTLILYF